MILRFDGVVVRPTPCDDRPSVPERISFFELSSLPVRLTVRVVPDLLDPVRPLLFLSPLYVDRPTFVLEPDRVTPRVPVDRVPSFDVVEVPVLVRVTLRLRVRSSFAVPLRSIVPRVYPRLVLVRSTRDPRPDTDRRDCIKRFGRLVLYPDA